MLSLPPPPPSPCRSRCSRSSSATTAAKVRGERRCAMSVTRMRRVRVERGRLGQSEGDSGGARATRVERGRLRCPGRGSRASRLPVPADAGQGGAGDSEADGRPPPPSRRPAAGLHPGCYREPRPEVQVCVCVCVCGGGKRARGAGGASGGVRAPAGGCQRRELAACGRRYLRPALRPAAGVTVADAAILGHRCRCRTMPAEALPLSPVIERLGSATASETSLSERMTPALQAQLMPANRDTWPACQ